MGTGGMFNLGAAFLMGLFGSVHCVGMCGPVVIVLSTENRTAWWPGVAAYQAARVFTYAALGVVPSLGISLLGNDLFRAGTQKTVSLFAGTVIVYFALQLGGWAPSWRGSAFPIPSSTLKKAANGHSLAVWGAAGTFNGLLPCGLVYAALAAALASGRPIGVLFTMLAFGAGTVPAMVSAAAIARTVSPVMRGKMLKLAAILLTVYGGWIAVRGFLPVSGPEYHQMPAMEMKSVSHYTFLFPGGGGSIGSSSSISILRAAPSISSYWLSLIAQKRTPTITPPTASITGANQ